MPWLDEHFEKMSLCSVFWRRGNAVIRLKPAMDAISSSQMVPPKPSTHRWHNKADLAEHYTACRSAYEAALTDAIEDRHGITTRTTFKEVKRIMQSEEFWASCATTAALMRPLKVLHQEAREPGHRDVGFVDVFEGVGGGGGCAGGRRSHSVERATQVH